MNIEKLPENLLGTPSVKLIGMESGRKAMLTAAASQPKIQIVYDSFLLICSFICIPPYL